MHPRLLVWRPSLRLVVFATIACTLVVAVSLLPGGWGRAYGDTTPGNGGGNLEHCTNGHGSDAEHNKHCRGESEVSQLLVEKVIGGEPDALDTERQELSAGGPFHSADGIFDATQDGGEPVELTYDPIPPDQLAAMNDGTFPGPAGPSGLVRVAAANVQLQPTATPNHVTLTLHYTDEQLAALGVSEASLGVYLFVPDSANPQGPGTWVKLPATLDPATNTLTISDVDVSAFANVLHQVAIFGHP
jgi:hypothetical protein